MSTELGTRSQNVLVGRRPDDNPVRVYLARLSSGSRRAMGEALDAMCEVLKGGPTRPERKRIVRKPLGYKAGDLAAAYPWFALRYTHTSNLRAEMAGAGLAPATVNKRLAALRGVLREAWRLGQIPADDYQRAVDLLPVKGMTLPTGRGLSAGEVRALFAGCGSTAAGARDAALLAVLYGAGLRRSEAVGLNLADYNADAGTLTVRHGKGDKARLAHVSNGAKRALDGWIGRRGMEPGALFNPVDKSDRVTVAPITAQAVLYIVRRAAKRADVERFSPHDLRRSFIGDLLDAGADLSVVRELAGHSNIQTTARYDRRGERAKKDAAGLLHVPYAGE